MIGPNMPGFVADQDLTNNLAEVGIILLMFGVGLHFHMDDLLKVKGVAIPGAILQSLSATQMCIRDRMRRQSGRNGTARRG